MSPREYVARTIAAKWLAGDWSRAGLLAGAAELLGAGPLRTRIRVVEHILAANPADTPPSPDWLWRHLRDTPGFDLMCRRALKDPQRLHPVLDAPAFAPSPRFADLAMPRLATPGELAAWLRLTIDDLDWLADTRRQHGRTGIPILQHYRYAFVPKRIGPPRLVEEPKPRLKAIQRRILHEILDHVPTHPAAHGFVRQRSCVTGAAVHAGETIVVTVDLADFFLTTPVKRVHGIFRALGYPWAVARLLTGLCTTSTPEAVFQRLPVSERHDWATRRRFADPHLAQGAPTSPALANLAALGLDQRLAGLAAALDARYTRYADDLAFSGGAALDANPYAIVSSVSAIAAEEGYALNRAKTRVMRAGQRQIVTGLVVNARVNVSRASYDQLKAILCNCHRNGPAQENRCQHADFRAHLTGRVAWMASVNPARGAKLRTLLDQIRW